MKMPPANSRQRKIIDLLLQGECISPQEGIALHGLMNLTVAEVASLYSDLVMRGCAVQVGLQIKASNALLTKFKLLEVPIIEERETVPPMTRPPFRPLSARHIVSSRGMREGSNDLRAVRSYYGPISDREEGAQ